MELIYRIDFNSTNFYFKHILDDLIIEAKIKAKSKMYKGFILLVCNDTEKIESFFKILEEKLPLSIFLSGAKKPAISWLFYILHKYAGIMAGVERFELPTRGFGKPLNMVINQ